MSNISRKERAITAVKERRANDLATALEAQKRTADGATHAEAKQESSKDTREYREGLDEAERAGQKTEN